MRAAFCSGVMISAFRSVLALRRHRRCFCLSAVTLLVFAVSGRASLVDVTAPTTSWTIIRYGAAPSNDPFVDQQTGSAEVDIVGNALHPSVYTMFGDANTPSLIDGTLRSASGSELMSRPRGLRRRCS